MPYFVHTDISMEHDVNVLTRTLYIICHNRRDAKTHSIGKILYRQLRCV